MSKVERISSHSLQRIIDGALKQKAHCLIKFYSNNCHLCQNLRDYYHQVAAEVEDEEMYFFAFNVDDDPGGGIHLALQYNGVPSIYMISVDPPRRRIAKMPEPDPPHEHTWYTVGDIKSFIEQERKK